MSNLMGTAAALPYLHLQRAPPAVDAVADRLLQLEHRWETHTKAERAEIERLAQALWPEGFIGKDGRRLPNPLTRFLSRVKLTLETDCWDWQGSMQLNGYAAFPIGGRRWLAHRWIY